MSISTDIVSSWIHQGQVWIDLGKLNEAHDLLRNTEYEILHSLENVQETERQQLLADTYNSLSCYYSACNKPKVATSLLTQALQLQIRANSSPIAVAKTHLNLAASLSLLGRHEESLKYAREALNLLSRVDKDDEVIETISIAHHSIATQNEHLGRMGEAVLNYRVALNQLMSLCNPHPLIPSLEAALEDAENRNASIAVFVSERQTLREKSRVSHRLRPAPRPSWVPSNITVPLPSKAGRSMSPRRKKNRLKKLKPQNLTLNFENGMLPDITKGSGWMARTNMYNI